MRLSNQEFAATSAPTTHSFSGQATNELDLPTAVTPAEAQAILAAVAPRSRLLLARALALYLVLEDIPPVSLAPADQAVAAPLVGAGLLEEVDEVDQHLHDGAEWGVVPTGLLGYVPTERAIGLVLALVAGSLQDGWAWVSAAIGDYGRLRVFTENGPESPWSLARG